MEPLLLSFISPETLVMQSFSQRHAIYLHIRLVTDTHEFAGPKPGYPVAGQSIVYIIRSPVIRIRPYYLFIMQNASSVKKFKEKRY